MKGQLSHIFLSILIIFFVVFPFIQSAGTSFFSVDKARFRGNEVYHDKGSRKQVIIVEHEATFLEKEKLKQKVGVRKEGVNHNQIINGYGTGLRPPTEEEWAEIVNETHIVNRVLFNQMVTSVSSVDHTTKPWFPPIGNQDGEGSCVAWAVGYYMKTFQEAKEHGWNLTGIEWEGGYYGHPSVEYQCKMFSPDFIYHLINHGVDQGSSFFDAMNLIACIGACSWEKMPYDPSDYASWPSEEAWKEAPLYRGNNSGYEYMWLGVDEDLISLKNWLASDHLAVISVDADQYSQLTSEDFWTLDNYVSPSVNHANTIVGYDDYVEYMEEGEIRHGAFKIANSWGVGGWENVADGCYWMSYEVMKQRVGYCMFYRDLIGYEPELVASFGIVHSKRVECEITVGMGNTTFPIQTKRLNDYINGGDHPFCSNRILFDITEFKHFESSVYNQSFFLKLYDGGSSTTGTINKFTIEHANSDDTPLNTVNSGYVFANVTLLPLETSWVNESIVSSDEDFIDAEASIATDSNGDLYIAYEDWFPTVGRYGILVQKSTDRGSTWSSFKHWYWTDYDCYNPSIAIDPYDNRIYVAYERVYPSLDHDIYCWVYSSSVGENQVGVDTDGEDDRYPSVTSEYQRESVNYQYISYEYLHTYNDRDLMFAKSTDHGVTWSIEKLHGDWPDYNVHTQISITNAEGYIYIAYRWGADYGSTCEIRVNRSTDFGNSWTQYTDIDGLPNDCSFPSIEATHGGDTVLVAFQYAWSASDSDVWYSFSTDKGASWMKGKPLFVSAFEDEKLPALTVDGGGVANDDVGGYFHVVCKSGSYLKYRKAYYTSPTVWTSPEFVSARWVGKGLAVTTQLRGGNGQFYPCVTWTDGRTRNIYYSTTRLGSTTESAYLTVRGLDNRIYYRLYNYSSGSWGSWNVLPQGATCDSPATAVIQNELHIVVQGLDGYTLWHGYLVDPADPESFSGWTRLNGATLSAPTLVSYNSQLILIVRGLNNRIYYRYYNCVSDDWEGWTVLPSGATSDSPAATILDNELHIVVRGFSTTSETGNYSLWHGRLNLTTEIFSGWTRLPGSTPSAPTLAASQTLNRLYLVVRGLNDRIYFNIWNGIDWEGWTVLPSGTTCDSPAATIIGDELHIVVRGMAGTSLWHYHINLSTSGHSGWDRITGATWSAPTLTS